MSVFVRLEGRREQVKLRSMHAPVRSIVGDALAKFGQPAASVKKTYALRSARTKEMLDPATSFAHTGLSLNAELELLAVERKRGSVRVAVGVEDSSSFEEAVDADAALGSVFRDWRLRGILRGAVASCRVLRESLAGEALQRTTLRDLGYGPSSSVRLHLTLATAVEPSQDLALATNEVEAFPEEHQQQKQPMDCDDAKAPTTTRAQKQEDPREREDELAEVARAVRLLDRSPAAQQCARTLEKYASAILEAPREPRFRTIPFHNAAFRNKVASVAGGVEVLRAVGFREKAEGEDALTLGGERDFETRTKPLLRRALSELAAHCPPPAQPQPQRGTFDAFRSSRLDLTGGAGATRAESDAERDLRKLQRRRREALESSPTVPERQLRAVSSLLHKEEKTTVLATTTRQPSDSSLVRQAAAQRAAKQRQEVPLTTAAARELDKLRKTPLYAAARLKILVDSQDVAVTATFGVQETLQSVVDLLRADVFAPETESLRLFTAPPVVTLDPTQTLADFAPSSVVRVDSSGGALKPGLALCAADDVPAPEPILPTSDKPASSEVGPPDRKRGRGAGGGGQKPGSFAWLKTG